MAQLIDKSALVAEIGRRFDEYSSSILKHYDACKEAKSQELGKILTIIDTLEVKDVDEQKERMNDCPFRKVGCTMYEGRILECKGACSWVVDYPKLKELNTKKEE